MIDEKKPFSITACPRCGCEVVEISQYISGRSGYRVDLKTKEADYSSLYDGMQHKNINKYAICVGCGKRIIEVSEIEEVLRDR